MHEEVGSPSVFYLRKSSLPTFSRDTVDEFSPQRKDPILFEHMGLPFAFRGSEIAGTRTRPGQMHPQEAQAKPKAENAVHHAAAVIAREKVSRETVPDDSRKSGILVVPSSNGNAGGTFSRHAGN